MKEIYFYYFVAILYWFSLYTYPAYLPIHIQSIVHDLSHTGAILSMYGLVQIFIRLPLGIVSDVLGKRKPFIVIGLIALGVGPLILAKSSSAGGLFIGRAITGLAAGTWVPLAAHIIDKSSKDVFKTTNTLSFIGNLASILAVVVTPLLTLTRFGIIATFGAASFSAFIAIIIWILSTKKINEDKTTSLIHSIWSRVKNPAILFPGFLFAIIQFGIYTTTFTFIPLIGRKLQLPDNQFNKLLIIYFAISICTNIILKKVLNKQNRKLIGAVSIIFLSLGIIITGYSTSFFSLIAAQLFIGISHGIGMPLFLGLAMSESKSESRAISMGVFQSAYSIGMFAGPPISTRLVEICGISTMSIIVAIFTIVLGTVLFLQFNKLSVIEKSK
jgi:DHA1 family multidrug resistance protein-like MFS transporter